MTTEPFSLNNVNLETREILMSIVLCCTLQQALKNYSVFKVRRAEVHTKRFGHKLAKM